MMVDLDITGSPLKVVVKEVAATTTIGEESTEFETMSFPGASCDLVEVVLEEVTEL